MKKILFAFMALATAFAATSCQSDEELTQQPTGKPMVINAVAEGIGTGVRATMAYKYDILWSEKDQIYVKNSTNNATFTLTAGQETTKGTFECKTSPFGIGDEVEAYYPATLVDNGNLVWPAEQTTNTVVPMYSKQTLGSTGTENFSFASLGAMLQIVFNTEQAGVTLKSITIKDGTNPLSGTFTVNEDGMAVMTTNANAPGITLDLGTGKALGKGANFFNIAVPAGTYSNLSITFKTTDNTVCTLTGNVTINHNTVGRLTLTGSKFKHIGIKGTEKATIGGNDVDVNWVQLWKDGPRFAEYNVGVTDGKAESFGGYYCWGSNIDKDSNRAFKSGAESLSGTDDTATKLWGSKWRMPTSAELENLLKSDNCNVEWKDDYNGTGKNGLLCTGKGDYSSNSVFLPAAGFCNGGSVYDQGNYGDYWSSTANGSDNAFYLYFDSGGQSVLSSLRGYGNSVRAVLAE